MYLDSDCLISQVGWDATANECVDVDVSDFADATLYWNRIPGLTLTNLFLATKNADGSSDAATFEDWLLRHRENSVKQVLIDFKKKFQQYVRASEVMEHEDLGFNMDGRRLINKAGRFCFISMKPISNLKEKIKLTGLSLETNNKVEDLKIYVYSSSKLDPIMTIKIDTNTEEVLTDQLIDYWNKQLHNNANYYIGYYEDDLTDAQAYATIRAGCNKCEAQPIINTYAAISSGYVLSSGLYMDNTLPDFKNCFWSGMNESYGLNLRFSIGCDLTPLVCDHADHFAPLIYFKGGIDAFWTIFNSNSVDSSIVNMKDRARLMAEKYTLDYQSELKKLSVDFSSLDCLCFKGRGILQTLRLTRNGNY